MKDQAVFDEPGRGVALRPFGPSVYDDEDPSMIPRRPDLSKPDSPPIEDEPWGMYPVKGPPRG